MYIKKSVLAVCAVILVIATAVGTVMAVNPFGVLGFNDFFKFNTGVAVLKRYFYEDLDNNDLVDGALTGLAYSANDAYTLYMNTDVAEDFMESVDSDDYSGVGLYITSDPDDNKVLVVSPLSDSPAEKAGIVSGDKIVAIDGKNVSGDNIDEVAKSMKGKTGTEVKLRVLKKSTGEETDIVLNRATIKRETVESKMINSEVGYIAITQFGVHTYDEFAEQFNALTKKGMKKLVLDLRNNPGGYVDMAVKIADTFIDSGDIVYTMDRKGKKRYHKAEKGTTKLPIVTLTNGGSASASEILIGALKDHGIAKSVGEKTFGKGVTQIPYQFSDGSIIKVTDSRYYTPSGVCIDKEGIKPDVEVKVDAEKYADISKMSFSEDEQLRAAVGLLEKE